MNRIAGAFLVASAGCLVSGAWLLAPVAGVLTAGVLAGVAGVLTLNVGSR